MGYPRKWIFKTHLIKEGVIAGLLVHSCVLGIVPLCSEHRVGGLEGSHVRREDRRGAVRPDSGRAVGVALHPGQAAPLLGAARSPGLRAAEASLGVHILLA